MIVQQICVTGLVEDVDVVPAQLRAYGPDIAMTFRRAHVGDHLPVVAGGSMLAGPQIPVPCP